MYFLYFQRHMVHGTVLSSRRAFNPWLKREWCCLMSVSYLLSISIVKQPLWLICSTKGSETSDTKRVDENCCATLPRSTATPGVFLFLHERNLTQFCTPMCSTWISRQEELNWPLFYHSLYFINFIWHYFYHNVYFWIFFF